MSMPFDREADPSMFAEVPRPRLPEPLPDGSEFPNTTAPGDADADEGEFDYQARVKGIIDDSREFNAEVLTPIRERGIQFYLGLIPALDDEGRSTIVATEVRDTVLAMLPSLMRIFTGQESTVNFIPTRQADVDRTEQANDYINYVFQTDNPGYMILQDVFKDGMIKSMGVVKWWTDSNLEVVEERYERMTLEQRQLIISQEGVQVVKMDAYSRQGPGGEIIPTFDMTVRREKRAPIHRVMAVPPDEFRINRTATTVKDSACVGREWFATQSELLRRGVPRELINESRDFSGGDMRFTLERMLRNQGADSPFGRDTAEPLCRFGEYWIRIDKDGDGLAELRHICVIGDNQIIVVDDPANRAKMAICCPDPEPHSIVGHSIAELIADLQVIKSNMLRGSLDSLAQTIYPRLVGVDNLVDWDDVLNQAIGAPIRVKDITAVQQLQYTFVGQPVFDMMDRLDAIRMSRTGVSEQSKGLDPKALQSTTVKGVEMIITGAQERIELVARTMASTFMEDMFSGLLQEVTENPSPARVIRLRGKFVTVTPDEFDQTMSCRVNGAMGRGSDSDRFMMLNTILAKQELILQSQGLQNPMVSPMEYRNTLEDVLALAGLKNVNRYFKEITPETMQAFMQQQAAKEDPNIIFAKAEADKVRAEIVKILADARVKTEDMTLKDDASRDKTEGDQMLKAAEIDAKYGAAVDTAAIQALWKAPRQPPGAAGPSGKPGGPPPGAPGQGPPQPQPGASAATGAPDDGPKPPLPLRTALGHGPPQLPVGGSGGPPAGLLGPSGPGTGG